MTTPTPAAAAPAPAPAAAAPSPAPAAPAAAAPAPAPAASAPAPAGASLLDAAPAVPAAPAAPAAAAPTAAPAAPAPAPAAPAPAAPAPAEPTWFYAEGVPGKDAKPDWFKGEKYKSVEEQAKAYPELEKRLGSFTGAPADGKYEFTMPEGITGEFDVEHPIYKGFTDWAAKNQLSGKGYNELLGMFAQYEASVAPDMGRIKSELGDNADARITSANAWAKANLDSTGYETFRAATAGANAAAVFQVIESVIAKTRQVVLPQPGQENPAGAAPAQATPEALIQVERSKLGADGRPLYFSPTAEGQAHRAKVDRMQNEYFKTLGTAA